MSTNVFSIPSIIMGSELIYYHNYFRGVFLFIIILLALKLVCTFRRIRLFIFNLFFERRLIPTLFLILGWGWKNLTDSIVRWAWTLFRSCRLIWKLWFRNQFFGSGKTWKSLGAKSGLYAGWPNTFYLNCSRSCRVTWRTR